MKKIVAVVLVAIITAASVFAYGPAEDTVSPKANEIDLFADVDATPLGEVEMEAIEGEGWLGAIIGAAVGAVVGAASSVISGKDTGEAMLNGAMVGAIVGGVFIPLP